MSLSGDRDSLLAIPEIGEEFSLGGFERASDPAALVELDGALTTLDLRDPLHWESCAPTEFLLGHRFFIDDYLEASAFDSAREPHVDRAFVHHAYTNFVWSFGERAGTLETMPAQRYSPPPPPLEQLYTVNGVAGVLEKSRGFVYQLVRDGDLHPIRVGARLRFTGSDVRAFLDRASETEASP